MCTKLKLPKNIVNFIPSEVAKNIIYNNITFIKHYNKINYILYGRTSKILNILIYFKIIFLYILIQLTRFLVFLKFYFYI